MKKKIIATIVVLAIIGGALFGALPAFADAPGPLDHVQITPSGATLTVGNTQQFTAQGFDAANTAIPNLNYFWIMTAGGGAISSTGLFTAGSVPGTYTDTVQAVAVQGSAIKTAFASVTINASSAVLDHVTITPVTATVLPNGTKQFNAQGFDSGNAAIAGLTYTWAVVAGGGIISDSGLFTAGAATGTFANTVKVTAKQGTLEKTATASVTVSTTTPAPQPSPKPNVDIKKISSMFTSYIKAVGFDNFLGGQWQVKNGTATDTVKIIPGVVETVSETELEVLANGQTAPTDFTLTSSTSILPNKTQLAANDKVVVVTINDQVVLVMKISVTSKSDDDNRLPPGLSKQGKERPEDKKTPPGWSKGKKTGWDKAVEIEEDEDD